jgi:hypothetical protein
MLALRASLDSSADRYNKAGGQLETGGNMLPNTKKL